MPAQGSGRLTIRFRENVDQLGFIASQSLDLGTAANCRCTDGDQKLKVFSRQAIWGQQFFSILVHLVLILMVGLAVPKPELRWSGPLSLEIALGFLLRQMQQLIDFSQPRV
jgi:hypothetical protein